MSVTTAKVGCTYLMRDGEEVLVTDVSNHEVMGTGNERGDGWWNRAHFESRIMRTIQ